MPWSRQSRRPARRDSCAAVRPGAELAGQVGGGPVVRRPDVTFRSMFLTYQVKAVSVAAYGRS